MPEWLPRHSPGKKGHPAKACPAYAGCCSNMFYVYILISLKDNNFYIGHTDDLKRRYQEHIRGWVKSTRDRRPLKLICYEAYLDRGKAAQREKFLKSSDGKKDIRKRIF